MEIRRAIPEDAPGIAAVKEAVWPVESAGVTVVQRIAEVIALPDHAVFVAVESENVAGFIDGFLTYSREEVSRWEVDLLAAHPDYHERGIGWQLVEANTIAGAKAGAHLARTLILLTNTASQRTFARCGYRPESQSCALYTSSATLDTPLTPPEGLWLVPVTTLNYRGVWLEGELSVEGFRAAQAMRTELELDLAGAVISLDDAEGIQAARVAGFTLVGLYQWWMGKF